MLEAGSGYRKFERFLVRRQGEEAIDEAAGEGIASTNAVDDVGDFVMAADEEFLTIVHAGGPAVVACTFRFAQSDGDGFERRVFAQNFFGEGLIDGVTELAGVDIDIGGDAEGHLAIFFIGDDDVNVRHEQAHDFGGLLAVLPKIFAVIEIAGNGEAEAFGFANAFNGEIGAGGAQGGGDTGDVEPGGILEGGVPIEIAGFGQSDGGEFAVVDHF